MRTSFSRFARLCVVTLALTIAGTLCATRGNCQPGTTNFDSVPEASRSSLVDRLSRFIEYHRNEDFEQLYDFYVLTESKKSWVRRRRKEMKRESRTVMTDFTPRRVSLADEIESGAVMIEGCAEYKEKDHRFALKEILVAVRRNDKWYFQYFGEVYDDGSCKAASS